MILGPYRYQASSGQGRNAIRAVLLRMAHVEGIQAGRFLRVGVFPEAEIFNSCREERLARRLFGDTPLDPDAALQGEIDCDWFQTQRISHFLDTRQIGAL